MRTAQLVLSAVALALAVGSVAVLTRVMRVPGLELAALGASVTLLPPMWCLLAGWLARVAGWKMRLALLLMALLVGLLNLLLLPCSVAASRWEGTSGGATTYFIHVEIGLLQPLLLPLGLVSLLLGGICWWRQRRAERAATKDGG